MLAIALLVMAAFATQLVDLTVNNSTDSYLASDDPIRVEYDNFRERYGLDTRITLAIEGEIFALPFLERLREFHEAIEAEVEHIDEVTSLINARDTRGENDTLIVGALLDDWPTRKDLPALRARAHANPLYRNTLISGDGTLTTLAIQLQAFAGDVTIDDALAGFDEPTTAAERGTTSTGGRIYLSDKAKEASVVAAQRVAERFDAPGFRISSAGAPVMAATLNTKMISDLQFFVGASLAVIALVLAILFRRPSAIILPLAIILLSLVATFGALGAAGYPIGVGTQILPSFLMAVGVSDAVHILAIYYLMRRHGKEKERAIAESLGHSALPILMTSLTTAGGLGSFVAADLAPIAELGLFAPIGVMFAFLFTVIVMPAAMAVLPMGSPLASEGEGIDKPNRFDSFLSRLGQRSAQHRLAILMGTAAAVAFSLAGASFIYISHNPVEWLPEDDRLRNDTLMMNERLEGVNTLEVIVSFPHDSAVKSPGALSELEIFETRAKRYSSGEITVGQTLSILDVMRETHQALNANDPSYYVLPKDRELIAQELLLFENSGTDDLEELVDPSFSEARMSLRIPWVDALNYPDVIRDFRSEAHAAMGSETEVAITGLVAILARTFDSVFTSMIRSYSLAIIVIVPLMMLLLGSVRLGLLSMIPNITPIALLLGYMGWSQTPIDGMTLMAGSIILGLAVDDTIHFMHNFRRSYVATGDALVAIDSTLRTAGRALFVTSLVLASGFSAFGGAYMANVRAFGLLTAGTILVAFVSNIVVGSALMSYASEWGIDAGRKQGRETA